MSIKCFDQTDHTIFPTNYGLTQVLNFPSDPALHKFVNAAIPKKIRPGAEALIIELRKTIEMVKEIKAISGGDYFYDANVNDISELP